MNRQEPRRQNLARDERGMATIETIPLLVIFVVMMAYTLGSFGIIHTGILNSIAARNYAFETFRNRTSLVYFRDTAGSKKTHFQKMGLRIHTIKSETGTSIISDRFFATERPIRMGMPGIQIEGRDDPSVHNQKVLDVVLDGVANKTVMVNPAWIITQYGICLNARCGD